VKAFHGHAAGFKSDYDFADPDDIRKEGALPKSPEGKVSAIKTVVSSVCSGASALSGLSGGSGGGKNRG
jgi:hypothetical protein